MIVNLTDDLDGSEAVESISFALDGVSYGIDLNAKNAATLRRALDKYISAARQESVPSYVGHRRRVTRKGELDPKVVRAWAEAHGLAIRSHGRISSEVIEQYRKASS